MVDILRENKLVSEPIWLGTSQDLQPQTAVFNLLEHVSAVQ